MPEAIELPAPQPPSYHSQAAPAPSVPPCIDKVDPPPEQKEVCVALIPEAATEGATTVIVVCCAIVVSQPSALTK